MNIKAAFWQPVFVYWQKSAYCKKQNKKGSKGMSNDDYVEIDGVKYSKDLKTLISCEHQKFGEVIIPEGVETISEYAFSYCKISSVVMPNSLKEIQVHAFECCYQLEHVDFGHGITEIGRKNMCNDIFERCYRLKSVTIPSQVKSIGKTIFLNCGLEEVIFEEGLEEIWPSAFLFCNRLKTLNLPKSLKLIKPQMFSSVYTINLKTLPYDFIYSVIGDEMDYSITYKHSIKINFEGKSIYLPNSMEPIDRKKVNYLFNNDYLLYLDDDFKLTTFQFALTSTVHDELACYIYNDVLQRDDIDDISPRVEYLRNLIEPRAYHLVQDFLKHNRIEDAVMVIKFGLLTDKDAKALLDSTDNTVIKSYLLENIGKSTTFQI